MVFGEGPSQARVMLIGQNPGANEDRLGRPFVGRSGRYLDTVLAANSLRREDIFITSVVKCMTPGNRHPTREEIDSCLPLLEKQMKSINPEIIVLMGEVARSTPRLPGIRYIETYHPAAAMRFPKIRQKFEADFHELARSIKS
jgi:uracil-DNA glycosylase